MELNIVNEYTNNIDIDYERIFNMVLKQVQKVLDINDNSALSVILVDDEKIHEINKEYRNIDRPTDVISFALLDSENIGIMDNEEIELGDIFISIDACKRQAEEYEHGVDRELGFLFTHGVLHLLGYDHMNEEDEKIMFSKQREIIDEILPR